MSGKLASVVVGVLVCAGVAVAYTAGAPAREAEKTALLGAFKRAPALVHTDKVLGPLSVHIDRLGKKPEAVGDTFVLRATISSGRDLDTVGYKWSIPPGVEVVSGPTDGTTSLKGDAPATYELLLKKVSDGNAQVHFVATGGSGAMRFGDSAQHNTDTQEEIDANAEQVRQSADKDLKVFH